MHDADTLYYNGVIYTAAPHRPSASALAVKSGHILALGDVETLQSHCGPHTQKVDLEGRFVMPGFIDSHLHPPGLALLDLYEVNLTGGKTMSDYLDAVRAFLTAHPDAPAVYGRGWSWAALTGEEAARGPRKEQLDDISDIVPIILRAYDGHTLWLNSAALRQSNITNDTVSPAGGIIEHDPLSGKIWGTLKENAMRFVPLPQYTQEQYTEAIRLFQQKMHQFGITGILALGSHTLDSILGAFAALEGNGKLQLHVRGAATVSPQEPLEQQRAAIEALRQQYASEKIRLTTAKFFADGVIEGGTSHLLKPYETTTADGQPLNGPFLWSEDKLIQAFIEANRRSLQVHVHATGDGAVQKTLHALQAAAVSVPGNHRNVITHLQLVDPSDIPRFTQLGVIASVQPYWHCKGPGWWENVDRRLLGERAEAEFPLAAFFRSGAVVAASSDYHATIVPYPMLAISTGVTRNLASGAPYGLPDIDSADDSRYLLNATERATLDDMLLSFTANNAYLLQAEQLTGSLSPGKAADFIILSANPFDVAPVELAKISVMATYFQGQCVYGG